MLFRKHSKDSLLSRAKSLNEDSAVEEEQNDEVRKEEASEAQLVQMGGGEDVDIDAIAEKHFTHMGSGKEESEGEAEAKVEAKDVTSQPVQPEELSDKEENQDVASEKAEEKTASTAESKEDGSLTDIFKQEEEEEATFLDGLIAALPDITAQELLKDLEEVNALIREVHQTQTSDQGDSVPKR